MSITPNMGLDKPTLGGDSGAWDDKLNTSLDLLDAHDHTAGNGTRVPVDGLDIDEDLPFGGFGLTDVGRVVFFASAAPSDAVCLYVSSSDNELYWRTFSGADVKLTSGTTINTSLVGGIGGDYSTVGAEVAYDDGSDRYTFKQQGSPRTWARIACGDVRLYETGTNETVFVGLKAPAGLAVSYDVTFPDAVPDSTSLMLMDAGGVMTVSNTVPNAIAFSAGITTTTLAASGNATVGGTLGVTGVLTPSAGITVPSGQSITLTNGRVIFTAIRRYPVYTNHTGYIAVSGTTGSTPGAAGINFAVSTVAYIPLPVHTFESGVLLFDSLTLYSSLAGGNVTLQPFYVNEATGAFTSLAALSTQAAAPIVTYTFAAPTGLPSTGSTLWLKITTDAATSGTTWSVSVAGHMA